MDEVPVAPDGDPVSLPQPLQQIANDHVQSMNAAPIWVKELRGKTVADYFPTGLDEKSKAWATAQQNLLADSQRLHEYYEGLDNTGLYKKFVEQKLTPFINQLNAQSLNSAFKNSKMTRPVREWTVETLVVTEQVAYLGRYPNFVKNAMSLLSGKHLRGASALAGVVVMGAVGVYVAHSFNISTGVWTGVVLAGGALSGAFQAGPLAAILNAGTSWFIQPTTEFVKLISSRYTGPLEQRINNVYDLMKPNPTAASDATRNETPNIPTVERDGMDFAGMSVEEQKNNWNKNLRMWVAVAKTFGQLLRDTHHSGRVLMMISWSDEQLTTTLVESMDTKLLNLAIEAETLLTPYKTMILANASLDAQGRTAALASLEANFDLYHRLNEKKWMDLDLTKDSMAELDQQIELLRKEMGKAGMTERDLARLATIQFRWAKAVSTIVTALTLNEIRSFNVAEANRNLEGEARQAQRAIRNGFHLQDYVNQYREHVQQMMTRMGYENSRKPLTNNSVLSCEKIF